MTPFIRDGDVITIAPARPAGRDPYRSTTAPSSATDVSEARGYDIGQIVAVVSGLSRRLVVHRIIGRHNSAFFIQGDNLYGPVTDTVNVEEILGRVVRIERGGRRIWLGLGPERYVIAALSRAGLLLPIRSRVAVLRRVLRRRPHGSS